MPIVATVAFDLLDMAVLPRLAAPSQHHMLAGREHGRTIPLAATACASQHSGLGASLVHQAAARHSALAPENFTTLPHFSVSSAISLPKSAGEPSSAVPP